MFGDTDNNSHNYYNFLNSKSHTKTSDYRCSANGLAHVKFVRYYQENGFYTHKDYFFRCLFPKQNKVSIKWRDEFDNLGYFVLFIDNNTIGYLDNTNQQVKKELIKKAAGKVINNNYVSLSLADLENAGICKLFYLFSDRIVDAFTKEEKLFTKLSKKLTTNVFLHFDPRRTTSYVCYDNNVLSNKSMREIIDYLGLKQTKTTKRRLAEYIKDTSEALIEDRAIKAYNAITTGKKLLIFRKGLNLIHTKNELDTYLADHQKTKQTEEEVKYRRNLMKKLKRCRNKADLIKRFSSDEIAYMSFDQRFFTLVNELLLIN